MSRSTSTKGAVKKTNPGKGNAPKKKRTYLGMAGHFAAMAEFLLRGYNVAIPEVDVGDDVFVVDDRDYNKVVRVQVKTATLNAEKGRVSLAFSRRQLIADRKVELTYVFVVRRSDGTWAFWVVSRAKLAEIRANFEAAPRSGKRGARPKSNGEELVLVLQVSVEDDIAWGASFRPFRNDWKEWPRISDGPGSGF